MIDLEAIRRRNEAGKRVGFDMLPDDDTAHAMAEDMLRKAQADIDALLARVQELESTQTATYVTALEREVERLRGTCCLTADTESSYEGTGCRKHGVSVNH